MANDYDGSIKIDTEIETKGVQNGLNDLSKKLTKFAKGGAGIAAVTTAFKATSKAIKETTQAYQTQIKAEKQLEVAAKNNPYLDKNSVSQLKEYAGYLQSISTVGDEELIPLMAQLATAGRTQAEIQSIMSAALDVSASGMMSLDSAVTQLNATYSGNVGLLGKQISELKNVTTEELKSGKAIEIISQKFKGMAEETAKATGTSQQLKNAWGDLKEEVGAGFEKALAPMRSYFTELISNITKTKKTIREQKEAVAGYDAGDTSSNNISAKIADVEKQIELDETALANYEAMTDANKKRSGVSEKTLKQLKERVDANKELVASLKEELEATQKLEEEQAKQNQLAQLQAENDAKEAKAKQEAMDTRDKLRSVYDETLAQAQREIEQRRALGEVITEQQEAQELLDIATQAYITMMSDPAFIGNNGTYEHEVNARKQIAEYAKTAAVDIKEIKQDTLEAANALIESFNNNSMADTIQETIDALQLEAKQFNENSTVYEFYVQKIQQLSELKKKVIQDEQKENLNTMLTNVKDYINQFADITDSIADLALENSTKNAEAETKQLDKSYTDGLISYEEYCNKKSEISKKQAQEEYKVKMWEWSASLLQATANIAQGVSSALSLTPPMSFIQAALVSAAGAVQLATLTSSKPQRPTFQTGGIVGGASYTGDHIDARVNSGEMILNAAQQANLWKMANNGNGSGSVVNMPVTIESRNGSNIQTQLDKNGLRIIVDDMVNTSLQLGRYSKSLNINNSKDSGVRYL